MVDFAYTKKIEPEDYRTWRLEVETCRPVSGETYEPCFFFGRIVGSKDTPEGMLLLSQPLWITFRQMRFVKTPMDKASALDSMLIQGKRLIKISIDRWHKGLLRIVPSPKRQRTLEEIEKNLRFTV